MSSALARLARELADVLALAPDRVEAALVVPPDESLGDYALPAFPFARDLGKAPPAVADDWAARFAPGSLAASARAAGPYLNLTVDRGAFAAAVLSEIARRGDAYGGSKSGCGKTVVVEYSSPNIAKTFAVHHLRSTVIGNAIANLHEAAGWRTIRLNHLGDWGTQFGALLTAFHLWGRPEDLARPDAITVLMDLYVRFNEEKKRDPTLPAAARAAFAALEKGDADARALWESFRAISLREFQAIYDRLGIRFDETAGESAYASEADDLIAWLQGKGLVQTSEGALIVDLSAHKMPPCLLRKGDEASLYATRDLAAARRRHARYRFDKMLYVVGMPQDLHFRQVFKVLELAGCDWVSRCRHVPFGHYQGMRTREGTYVLLQDVLDEAVKRTAAKIRNALREGLVSIPQEEIPAAAEAVGVGAVVFNDLKTRRVKDVVFDWDDLLNFQGRTGPYVQYAHARVCGILRKLGGSPAVGPRPDAAAVPLVHDAELRLLKHLAAFPRDVERGVADAEPSHVAAALLDLCKAFSQFYEQCSVVGAKTDPTLFAARVDLIRATGLVIRNGLRLLGLRAPERM